MSFTAGSARLHNTALGQIFDDHTDGIAAALGAHDVGLKEFLQLDRRHSVPKVVTDFKRNISRLRESRLWRHYGAGAGVFYGIAFPIMTHEPVTVHAFDEQRKVYGQRLANALYAVAVALTYLKIDIDDGGAIVQRLAVYLISGGVPDSLEANLASLRGFLDAYTRRRLIVVGPRVLRERFAIA